MRRPSPPEPDPSLLAAQEAERERAERERTSAIQEQLREETAFRRRRLQSASLLPRSARSTVVGAG